MGSLRTLGGRCAPPALLVIAACLAGCAAAGAPRDNGLAGASGADGSGGAVNGNGGVPGVTLPDGSSSSALLAARIRRLTPADLEASLRDVLGDVAKGVTAPFAPDALQGAGFTVNAAQIVDPVLIKQLSGAADAMAANVKTRLSELAPCADPTAQGEACATTFIQAFAGRAYRRPIEADEVTQLLKLYHAAADSSGYAAGIEQVARAALQSASFLYQTEIGDGSNASLVKLTPHELANTLSYALSEKPASPALLADALAGKLDTSEGRAAAAAALATSPAGLTRVTRIIGEWLGTARVAATAKDATVYDKFAALKPSFEAENADFLRYLLENGRGNVKQLLGATDTYGDEKLAAFYESKVSNPDSAGKGVISVPARVGILNRGAFLSVFAHANEPAPVLRGVALMRRVLCTDPGDPTKQNITVSAPPVDPSKTIRQRFEAHSSNAVCAGCHTSIDAYGFSFDHYDAMGGYLANDSPAKPNSSTQISFNTQFDGSYPDSNALAAALANVESVRVCFARQLYRASTGTSAPADSASEERFVAYWKKDSAAFAAGDIVATLKAYISSPGFALRRPQ